uniref:PA domain-containing protein n=1 Tax=Ditylum brightwellii TaxID=49249 RepID=A0A7S4RKI6_9STRA
MAPYQSIALSVILAQVLSINAETPDNVQSRLQVHVPQSLFKAEGYDHREALFGVPPYGGSIAQNVYFADADLCDANVDNRRGYPIRPKDSHGNMEPWPSPYILLVDRGGCSFVNKVRNAQRAGAAGVIIADNVCLCSDSDCVSANAGKELTCQTAEPIMADDGSGADISIPSFLMFKSDADLVKAELLANHMVQIEMQWALPRPDDRVEYDLWSVPSDVMSREFLKSFKPYAVALGEHAYFTPNQYIYDGIRSHCQGSDGMNMCYNLCTNNGRYCATDPDNDLDKGISGADVVKESLRRICIWKHYGESDGIGREWWDYVAEFQHRCDSPDYFVHDDCIKDVYKHSKVDGAVIDRCMRDSGGLETDATNSFLELALGSQTQRGVVVLPTAFVNNVALRGTLSPSAVFGAICSGFLDGTEPQICKQCQKCGNQDECIKTSHCSGASSSDSVSKHTFVFSLFMITAAFSLAAFYHWKKTREDMRDQVRGILAEYMPLEDQGDGEMTQGSPMDFARQGGSAGLIS